MVHTAPVQPLWCGSINYSRHEPSFQPNPFAPCKSCIFYCRQGSQEKVSVHQ